jgi:hypothetical protein
VTDLDVEREARAGFLTSFSFDLLRSLSFKGLLSEEARLFGLASAFSLSFSLSMALEAPESFFPPTAFLSLASLPPFASVFFLRAGEREESEPDEEPEDELDDEESDELEALREEPDEDDDEEESDDADEDEDPDRRFFFAGASRLLLLLAVSFRPRSRPLSAARAPAAVLPFFLSSSESEALLSLWSFPRLNPRNSTKTFPSKYQTESYQKNSRCKDP